MLSNFRQSEIHAEVVRKISQSEMLSILAVAYGALNNQKLSGTTNAEKEPVYAIMDPAILSRTYRGRKLLSSEYVMKDSSSTFEKLVEKLST